MSKEIAVWNRKEKKLDQILFFLSRQNTSLMLTMFDVFLRESKQLSRQIVSP